MFVEQTHSKMVMEAHWNESQQTGLAGLCFYGSFVIFKGMSVESHCV